MIKQLIEMLESGKKEARENLEPVPWTYNSGREDAFLEALVFAKQLQQKVRCENCKWWCGEMPQLGDSWMDCHKEKDEYCSDWEEK